MSFLTLYLIFLKASLSSFSGLASLPILRDDLVLKHHVLTDRELNTAVVIGRTTPGPKGLYVVSLGQYISGFSGATAAWLALVTPALLIIPVLEFAGRRADNPKVKQVLRAVVLASAGVSLSATLPLAADALHTVFSYAIALGALVILIATDLDTIWVILGGGVLAVLAAGAGVSVGA